MKLSGMMFLQYGGLGAWIVPLARWLGSNPGQGGLGFGPHEIAWIYSTLALGGLIAPLFTGILADRTFATEKLIGSANVILTVLSLVAGIWCQCHSGGRADPQAAFTPLFLILLTYSITIMSSIISGVAMTMRNLADPRRQFGTVRLIGTFGWVVAVAAIGAFLNPLSIEIFYVAAVCHGVLALTAWWLPHTPPLGKGKPLMEVIGLPAFELFRDPSFIIFMLVAFVASLLQAFYSVFANLCCKQLGMERPELEMTSSQFVEMACIASIPFFIRNFGMKGTMLLGLAGWAVRCAVFAGESLTLITWLGVPLQGLAYSFFSIVGSLYIDRKAPSHLRAGAQGLFTFFSAGPGTLVGNYIAGSVVAGNTVGETINWSAVWFVPTLGGTVIAIVFLLLFHDPHQAD